MLLQEERERRDTVVSGIRWGALHDPCERYEPTVQSRWEHGVWEKRVCRICGLLGGKHDDDCLDRTDKIFEIRDLAPLSRGFAEDTAGWSPPCWMPVPWCHARPHHFYESHQTPYEPCMVLPVRVDYKRDPSGREAFTYACPRHSKLPVDGALPGTSVISAIDWAAFNERRRAAAEAALG